MEQMRYRFKCCARKNNHNHLFACQWDLKVSQTEKLIAILGPTPCKLQLSPANHAATYISLKNNLCLLQKQPLRKVGKSSSFRGASRLLIKKEVYQNGQFCTVQASMLSTVFQSQLYMSSVLYEFSLYTINSTKAYQIVYNDRISELMISSIRYDICYSKNLETKFHFFFFHRHSIANQNTSKLIILIENMMHL